MNDTIRVLFGVVLVLLGFVFTTRKKTGLAILGAVLMIAGGWYAVASIDATSSTKYANFWVALVLLIVGFALISPTAPAKGATIMGIIAVVVAIIFALRVPPLSEIPIVGQLVNETIDTLWEKVKSVLRPVVK